LTRTHTVDPPQDPGDVGFCLSVRRQTLDEILVRRARREPTVDVLEGTTLRRLLVTDDRVTGVEISDDAGPMQIRARVVVGADGRASKVAELVGAVVQEEHPASRAMYYRYAIGMTGPEGDPDGPEFSLGDDELAYVFPSDGSTSCVALSVNLRNYAQFRSRARAAFEERLAAHPFLAPRIEAATWIGRLFGCGPRPGTVRVPTGPGWALVGDASLYQDPWTGLGMDNASVHATFLAEVLDDFLAGRAGEDESMTAYHRRRDEHALADFRETCKLGRDLNAFRDASTEIRTRE
jgi:flavin-dependent dehydrogenase